MATRCLSNWRTEIGRQNRGLDVAAKLQSNAIRIGLLTGKKPWSRSLIVIEVEFLLMNQSNSMS